MTNNLRNINRIRYIEPNYTATSKKMQGERGLHTYEFQNPLEDYSIFVNLKVEVRGRSIRTDYTTDSKVFTTTWVSQQGQKTVSFFQGTEYPDSGKEVNKKSVNSLTTEYLNRLYVNDIMKRDNDGKITGNTSSTELFGINSIDIQYNNWMVPEVTIKFTDIRGGSVFSTEEARHDVTNDGVSNSVDPFIDGSFFKCFFTFPYPKFTLTVKGFYGQPVAYELTCSDFRASFNSDTGNFEATAKFIGYSFSFLGDVTMNALTAAPFSDFLGKKYWEDNVSNGRFYLKDVNQQKVPMMTIGEIVTKVNAAMEAASGMVQSSPEYQETLKLENANENIQNVISAFTEYTKAVKQKIIENAPKGEYGKFNFAVKDGANLLAFLPDVDEGDTFNQTVTNLWDRIFGDDIITEKYKNLTSVTENNESYASKVKRLDPNKIRAVKVYKQDTKGRYKKVNTYDGYVGLKNGLQSNLEISNSILDSNNETLISKHNLTCAFPFIDNELSGQLQNEKEFNDSEIQKNQEEISKISDKAIADALGFNPSVENMTRVVMAHFETLMYMLTMCARTITGQNRTFESLGVTSNEIRDMKGISKKDKIVPPFPKVTKHTNELGVDKNEEAWVGEFNGDWLEKDMVNGLLNGINEMAEIIKNTDNNLYNKSGRLTSIMKIPLNPLDMILDKNPYGSINFKDKSSFVGHLILRMLEILSLNGYKFNGGNLVKLGEAEAINFAEFFKNPPKEFKEWIKNESVVETIFNIARGDNSTPATAYGTDGKYAWEDRNSPTKVNRGILNSDNFLASFRSEGAVNLPVQDTNFNKIIDDLGQVGNDNYYHKNKHPEDYILTNSAYKTSGKLICIEPNPDRFNEITMKQTQNSDVDLSDLVKTLDNETKYNPSNYKKFFRSRGEDYVKLFGGTSEDSENEESSSIVVDDDYLDKLTTQYDSFFEDETHKIDSMRVLFLPSVEISTDDIDVSDKATIFSQEKYYTYNIYDKAVLFLLSLNYYINYGKCLDEIVDESLSFSTVPYASLLYIGSACYFSTHQSNSDLKVFHARVSRDARLLKFRKDVKNDFSKLFEDWVAKDFARIDSYLSLNIINKERFFEALKNKEDVKTIVSSYLVGLSTNYASVDDDIYSVNNSKALKMIMRPESHGAEMVTNLVFAPYTFVKTSTFFTNPKSELRLGGESEVFLTSFIKKLNDIYSNGSDSNQSLNIDRANDCKTDNDIKLGVYRYLKLLYDKWVAGSVFENDFKMERFFGTNPDSTSADDRYFYFIDSFYNRIGNLLLINIGKFKEDVLSCELGSEYTLLSFLSQMYSSNKLNFLCVQNFMDLSDESNMERMFEPVAMMDMEIPNNNPNFIVMYPYESSSHLDLGENDEYKDDSFMISDKVSANGAGIDAWPLPLNSGEEYGYHIPAFGVSYGKMYQSYFQNISVSMDSPMVTEQSLNAQYQIASTNDENKKDTNGTATRGMITMGQDLFTIYSNNSYTCEIDMMGDAWVQPLMYFELLNVPMFRGTYLIEKVTHHIEPGTMTTHFTGVRMANTTTKLKKGWFWSADPTQSGLSQEQMEAEAANVTNDCNYMFVPVGEIDNGKPENNAISVMNYLIRKGATQEFAAGVVGNMWQESTMNPKAKQSKNWQTKGGIGLCQWTGARSRRIQKELGANLWSMSAQLNFMWKEMQEKEYNELLSIMKSCKSVETAVNEWLRIYEKAGKPETASRINYGKRAFEYYKKNGGKLPESPNFVNKDSTATKKILKDLVYSINQTSLSTPSIGMNIGTKNERGNYCELINPNDGNGSSEKLAHVFDMILNTYHSYIQELWWVARNNSDNTGPHHLILVASEKPDKTKIKVGMKILGSNEAFRSINKNSNEIYRRAIVKFYKDENNAYYKTVVKSPIDKEDWNKLRPTACADIINGGEGGENYLPSKPIGSDGWDAGKAASFLIAHALPTSAGICAFAVQQAIRAGGVPAANGSGYACAAHQTSVGFKIVHEGITGDNWYTSYKPQIGDIMGMKRGSDNGYCGHICMYCGSEYGWMSDFKQTNVGAYVYRAFGPGKYVVLRYSGGGVRNGTKVTGLCHRGHNGKMACLKS